MVTRHVLGGIELAAACSLVLSASSVHATAPGGMGDPAAVFAAPAAIDLVEIPDGFGLGDVDLDGLPDVVLPYRWFYCGEGCWWNEGMEVLLGAGDGSFPVKTEFDEPFVLFDVVDVDSDGNPDLVGSLPLWDAFVVQRQAFTGSPAPIDAFGQAEPQSFTMTDIDLDGDLDVALTRVPDDDAPPHAVDVRFNAGDGTFAAGYAYGVAPDGGARALDIAAGDLDGNGLPDLCTIRQSTIAPDTHVHVAIGTGQGAVTGTGIFWAGMAARQTRVVDLDGDGWMDVAVIITLEDRVRALRSIGDGTLVLAWDVPVPDAPEWLNVGDLDGDDVVDLFTGSTEGPVSLLLGQDAASFTAPYTMPGAMNTTRRLVGDVNLDGALDLLVVAAWPSYDLLVHGNLTADWQNLGYALPGAQGSPYLGAQGEPQPEGAVSARLVKAGPGAFVALFIGSSVSPQPLFGGTLAPLPQVVVFPLVTDAAGDLLIDTTWPADVLPGTPVVAQAWVIQAGASTPAASNAVGINLP